MSQAPQPPRKTLARNEKGLFFTTMALLCILTAYNLMWLSWMVMTLVFDQRIEAFGIDVYNTFSAGSTLEFSLVAIVTAGWGIALVLGLLQSRMSIIAALTATAGHLMLWLSIIDNPYYSGFGGLIILPLEFLISIGLVLLIRAGRLR
jgi:hypothetical protein